MRSFPLDDYGNRAPLRVGCLSQCFSAECTTEGVTEPVLLKQLLPALLREGDTAASWLAIAQQNTALQHPGCTTVLDFGMANGEAYVAFELLPGTSLRQLLLGAQQTDIWPSTEAVVAIAQGVLETLCHGQEAGLAHLDLDPHSVILSRDGRVVVTEFGMWRALPSAIATRERFDKGRVAYLAPELVKGQEADGRADVFSLGVILYELLGKKRPFHGPTQLVTAMLIAEGKRAPLRELAPELPEVLCDIVETMLAVSPDERFQSPRAALGALSATCVPSRPAIGEWLERLSLRAGPSAGIAQSTGGGPARLRRAPAPGSEPAQPVAAVRDTVSLPVRSAPFGVPASPPVFGALEPHPLAPPPLLVPGAHADVVHPSEGAVRPGAAAATRDPAANDWLAPPPLLAPAGAARGISSLPVGPGPDHSVQVRDGRTAFLNRNELPIAQGSVERTERGVQPALASMPPLVAANLAQPSAVSDVAPPPPSSVAPLADYRPPSTPLVAPAFQDFGSPAPARPVMPSLQSLPDLNDAPASDQRWHEPSKTVFQMKRFAKSATRRGDASAPLYVKVLLAMAFGFALVAGAVLLWRLLF